MALPESFPRDGRHLNCVMATTSVRGSLMVLVGDKDKVLAWVQSKQTLKWKQQILVATETIQQLLIDNMGSNKPPPTQVNPMWFAARSGVVLVHIAYRGRFWLDLQSMKIVRWLPGVVLVHIAYRGRFWLDLQSMKIVRRNDRILVASPRAPAPGAYIVAVAVGYVPVARRWRTGNTTCMTRHYVLLAGDTEGGDAGAVGRPFQVLIAKLDVSEHRRHLQIHTFSSADDTWGPYTEIWIPNLYGSRLLQDLGEALVVGGAVHWLCLTDSGSYVIKLHVKATQVTISELPESFRGGRRQIEHLLATTSLSGSPIVLVTEGGKISALSQSKQTTRWKQQSQQVTDIDELVRFAISNGGNIPLGNTNKIKLLHWFAERSGLVLIEIRYRGFIWLDIRTMEMVTHSNP
ncbi:hypothetical protein EJB05_12695, partial [Eragrostis curvula]